MSRRIPVALIALATALTLSSPAGAATKSFVVSGKVSIKYSDNFRASLTATLPTVKPSGSSRAIAWLRAGKAIAGATKSVYTITDADRGKLLTARLTITKTGYTKKVLTSASFKVEAKNTSPYKLIWSDEFNGAAGDPGANWVAQEGDGRAFGNAGWGNNELEYYLRSQAALDGNGNLVIKATNAGADAYDCYYGPCMWLSSKLVTKDVVGFKYGRIEARLKAAKGEGTWPAFWTLGANIDSVKWPYCGEIDIAEFKGSNPAYVWGTGHGPLSGGGGRGGSDILVDSTTTGFHTYAIDWTPTKIVWYLDNQPYYTYSKTDSDWVFDNEQYLILNLAMGGHWGGGVDLDLTNSDFTADYVRVYSINGVGSVITH